MCASLLLGGFLQVHTGVQARRASVRVATLLPIQGGYERETEGAGSWLSIIYLPEQTRVVL